MFAKQILLDIKKKSNGVILYGYKLCLITYIDAAW